jgi:glutathione S-transferase
MRGVARQRLRAAGENDDLEPRIKGLTMTDLTLYSHPFASFCQKVLIALYDADIPFDDRVTDLSNPDDRAELAALWPMARFPVLVDRTNGVTIPESTIIVEHLAVTRPAARRLLPVDPDAAREARLWDRLFDANVELPMQRIVFDHLRPADKRDPFGVEQARGELRAFYAIAEARLQGREWIAGEFSLADCGAAPALYYAHWVEPLGDRFPNLSAYLRRLAARPSYARVLREAQSFAAYFPVPMPPPDLG